MRILVVDDSADAANSLAMLLRIARHEVKTAYDGRNAVQAAKAFLPDVLLLDLAMPLMSGLDVAIQLRRDPGLNSVRLIALSGYADAHHRQRALSAGFDDFLPKPCEFGEVLAAIELKSVC